MRNQSPFPICCLSLAVFEIADSILNGGIDDDILQTYLIGLNGIEILCGVSVTEIDDRTLIYELNGKFEECEFDQIVVASGRKGNVESIGLENIGIEANNGFISVDDKCMTATEGVYACGDVIGKDMLAHVAYKEADIAVKNILGQECYMSYEAIPKIVYTDPEYASVGIGEKELIKQGKQEGIDYKVCKSAMTYSSRYVIMEGLLASGVCKLIFDKNDILIGSQIIGNGAGELIGWVADMVLNHETKEKIKDKIYPHPSICEILRETVG